MGKLIFIGVGLCDEKSLTLQALEAAVRCDMLFAEQYTSLLSPGSIKAIAKRVGKEIELLDRERVEDGSFLRMAENMTIGFMIPGDPMTATTHVDLRIRAHEMGIKCEIIHGTSALIAVPGVLGLQNYKFGRTITIPFPREGYNPTSPLELLLQNLESGLHTLALLDTQTGNAGHMTANNGLQWLLSTSERIGSDIINEKTMACVVARAGSPSYFARANTILKLLELDFGKLPHTIVIPGKLHFEEIEALVRFAKAPPELFLERERRTNE